MSSFGILEDSVAFKTSSSACKGKDQLATHGSFGDRHVISSHRTVETSHVCVFILEGIQDSLGVQRKSLRLILCIDTINWKSNIFTWDIRRLFESLAWLIKTRYLLNHNVTRHSSCYPRVAYEPVPTNAFQLHCLGFPIKLKGLTHRVQHVFSRTWSYIKTKKSFKLGPRVMYLLIFLLQDIWCLVDSCVEEAYATFRASRIFKTKPDERIFLTSWEMRAVLQLGSPSAHRYKGTAKWNTQGDSLSALLLFFWCLNLVKSRHISSKERIFYDGKRTYIGKETEHDNISTE